MLNPEIRDMKDLAPLGLTLFQIIVRYRFKGQWVAENAHTTREAMAMVDAGKYLGCTDHQLIAKPLAQCPKCALFHGEFVKCKAAGWTLPDAIAAAKAEHDDRNREGPQASRIQIASKYERVRR